MNISQACAIARDELCEKFHCTPWDINNGRCEDFVARVSELMDDSTLERCTENLPEEIGMWLPGHVWVESNGFHYDAECVEGVRQYTRLPVFERTTTLLQRKWIELIRWPAIDPAFTLHNPGWWSALRFRVDTESQEYVVEGMMEGVTPHRELDYTRVRDEGNLASHPDNVGAP